METEYIWKVVYKSYTDNNDIRVNYYPTDSQIFLKDNIISIEKIVKPMVDNMRLYDDYDTYHTFVMNEIYKANNTPIEDEEE